MTSSKENQAMPDISHGATQRKGRANEAPAGPSLLDKWRLVNVAMLLPGIETNIGAIRVLITLCDKHRRDGCFPGLRELGTATRLPIRSVRRAIERLEAVGALTIEKGRGRLANHYRLNYTLGNEGADLSDGPLFDYADHVDSVRSRAHTNVTPLHRRSVRSGVPVVCAPERTDSLYESESKKPYVYVAHTSAAENTHGPRFSRVEPQPPPRARAVERRAADPGPLADDWTLPPDWRAEAEPIIGADEVDDAAAEFRAHHQKNPSKRPENWKPAWLEWCLARKRLLARRPVAKLPARERPKWVKPPEAPEVHVEAAARDARSASAFRLEAERLRARGLEEEAAVAEGRAKDFEDRAAEALARAGSLKGLDAGALTARA